MIRSEFGRPKLSCTTDVINPNLSRRHIGVRKLKVHIVENVEELSAKLQVDSLRQLSALEDSQIRVEKPRPTQNKPSRRRV